MIVRPDDKICAWLWNKAQAAFDLATHRTYAAAYNNWVMFQTSSPCWQVPQFKGELPNPDRHEHH